MYSMHVCLAWTGLLTTIEEILQEHVHLVNGQVIYRLKIKISWLTQIVLQHSHFMWAKMLSTGLAKVLQITSSSVIQS